jgi:hypothetical protein
MAINEG